METTSRAFDRQSLEADLCIVGAGPAGLTLAAELLGADATVAVLESGERRPSPEAQDLCDGATVGDPYAPPLETRHRGVGGTPNIWNTWIGPARAARFAPLDGIDFAARDDSPWSGWPFGRDAIEGHYRRAQTLCGLGPFEYDGATWARPDRPVLPIPPDRLATAVFQLGIARRFTRVLPEELRRARNVQLVTNATVAELCTDRSGTRVTHARVRGLGGIGFMVRARQFVLAAGGLENPRLLLLSNHDLPGGLGNEHDLVGRCFMDHPRDFSCALVASDAWTHERFDYYDVQRTPWGAVMGRLRLGGTAVRSDQLNLSAVLRPRPGEEPRSAGRRPGIGRFGIEISLEQAPDPANRVVLGRDRDALGLPRLEVHWSWRESDRRQQAMAVHTLQTELQDAGLGRVAVAPEARLDPNAHHHMGTTRMHRDRRFGVVGPDGRVHDVANLFVAGSSVFPTGGAVNPTLTIVALALRLADHLKSLLGIESAAPVRVRGAAHEPALDPVLGFHG